MLFSNGSESTNQDIIRSSDGSISGFAAGHRATIGEQHSMTWRAGGSGGGTIYVRSMVTLKYYVFHVCRYVSVWKQFEFIKCVRWPSLRGSLRVERKLGIETQYKVDNEVVFEFKY